MYNILLNIIIFILGSLFGWILEYTKGKIDNDKNLINRNKCGDRLITGIFKQCLPLLNIYGLGAVILLNTYMYYNKDLSKTTYRVMFYNDIIT